MTDHRARGQWLRQRDFETDLISAERRNDSLSGEAQ